MTQIMYKVIQMPTGAVGFEANWQDTFLDFKPAAELFAKKLGDYQNKEIDPPKILDNCCFEDDHITLWVEKTYTPIVIETLN